MQMFRARCAKCLSVFDVCTLPMPIDKACAAIAGAHCPTCGNRDGNVAAEPRGLTPDERFAKLRAMAEERMREQGGPRGPQASAEDSAPAGGATSAGRP